MIIGKNTITYIRSFTLQPFWPILHSTSGAQDLIFMTLLYIFMTSQPCFPKGCC